MILDGSYFRYGSRIFPIYLLGGCLNIKYDFHVCAVHHIVF